MISIHEVFEPSMTAEHMQIVFGRIQNNFFAGFFSRQMISNAECKAHSKFLLRIGLIVVKCAFSFNQLQRVNEMSCIFGISTDFSEIGLLQKPA